MKRLLPLFLLLSFASPEKIHLLYTTLKPESISQHLAFYRLFPDSSDGKRALQDAWNLLSSGMIGETAPLALLSEQAVTSIVTLVTKSEGAETVELSREELTLIKKLTAHLPHQKLKGHIVHTEEEMLALPPEEIDIGRALLLAQAADTPHLASKIDSYEALIDLMALQILTKVSLEDTPEKKIREINRFIFEEMGYRFPPHSVFVKNVDRYTYLPSVIDSRKGVCLGVSILYLSLAQRLGLKLEAITPPGHIYVRYCEGDKTINIETTARGIHIDSEEYMGIEMCPFKPRTIKEVVGMAYVNEASVHWQNEQYEQSLKCYQKALPYIGEDYLTMELLAYNHLFLGNLDEGKTILQKVWNECKDKKDLAHDTMIEDYLLGRVDAEGIRFAFMHVDEERESLEKKRDLLEKSLIKWPKFRTGHFFLAVTWLQLNRYKEALKALSRYALLDDQDPTAHYLLAQLYAMRSNYPDSWRHLHAAEELLKGPGKQPKALKELRRQLAMHSPE
jgi:hypothetical protein